MDNSVKTETPQENISNGNPVSISENAKKALEEILLSEDENSMLRVFITGGGCSGFQYGFAIEEEKEDDDSVMNYGNINLVIDNLSFQYLTGSVIDFTDSVSGQQFTINNPNATTTCGCGSSFSV